MLMQNVKRVGLAGSETRQRRIIALIAGALALAATSAKAQITEASTDDTASAGPVAPRIEAGGRLVDLPIVITGYGRVEDRNKPPMRTPLPLTDPEEWMGAESYLAKAHLADPQLVATTVTLGIASDGRITSCELGKAVPSPFDEAALCADIAKQRFLPQLANDGSAVAGEYSLSIDLRQIPTTPDAPRIPLFGAKLPPTIAMTLADRLDEPRTFPPPARWMSRFYRAPDWKLAPQAGWGDTPPEAFLSATGLIVTQDGDTRECKIIKRTRNIMADSRACEYAKDTLAPSWSGTLGAGPFAVPLIIAHDNGNMKAIGPAPDPRTITEITEESDAALRADFAQAGLLGKDPESSALALALRGSSDGRVAHCRIIESTGADATDIAACRTAYQKAQLLPVEDAFGQPTADWLYFWRAKPRSN